MAGRQTDYYFFPEALETLKTDGVIEFAYHINGENPFDLFRFVESPDVLIVLGQVGCPACAGNLDVFHGFGIKKVMFCGFDYGAIIYGGDDVASSQWDNRGWNTRQGIRYNLLILCLELVKVM